MNSCAPNALVLLSGGTDSFACCHFLKNQGYSVQALHIDFGQISSREERLASEKISRFLDIDLDFIVVDSGKDHFDGEIVGRNAMLVFLALQYSPKSFPIISIGILSGTPYYDCSPNFVKEVNDIVRSYTRGSTSVIAPFINWTKGDVLNYFFENHLPFELAYSCEKGSVPPCGTCLSCKDLQCLKV